VKLPIPPENVHSPTFEALTAQWPWAKLPGPTTRMAEALGEQAALSKSTVSRICQVLVSQFELWQKRDLSDYELDYLFADASFFKYHPGAAGEPILTTWGITTEGKKVFIGLTAGAAESYDSWHAHFADLRERGLKSPLLGITDGAAGLVSAFEQVLRIWYPSEETPNTSQGIASLHCVLRSDGRRQLHRVSFGRSTGY
jgi:hypothetical protein